MSKIITKSEFHAALENIGAAVPFKEIEIVILWYTAKIEAEKNQYRWRDVKEELPEVNKDYIGRWWANAREKCHFDGKDWWYVDKMVGTKKCNVAPSHFMPMPKFEVEE